jgi:hypothetical protein
LLWEQVVGGSNPLAPTILKQDEIPYFSVYFFNFSNLGRRLRKQNN